MSEMDVEKAIAIVKHCAEARLRWGKYAFPAYTQVELMDALVAMHKAGRFDAPSDEEITKLRRQLAACENREKARKSEKN
jgi:hypothetical protein